jgi:hypothetical protein
VQGLIDRHDLVATLDRVVGSGNDHLSARRQQEDVAAARVGRPCQDYRITLMSVWPGQRDAQLF